MSVETLRNALRTFQCGFVQHYGMTEACGSKYMLPPETHSLDRPELLETCGRAMPGVETRIVNGRGESVAPGEAGEVWLKSATFATEYVRAGACELLPLIEGWYASGDVGRLDQDGYLTIVDRKKDMIVSGGANIYPAEIECVLTALPGVKECAVIGVPDARWGEVGKAFVVPVGEGHCDAQELLDAMRTQIADYKVPKSIELVTSLPRSPVGKVLKDVLREPFWRGRSRQVN